VLRKELPAAGKWALERGEGEAAGRPARCKLGAEACGAMVTIELSKEKRTEAIASIKKYFEEEIREPIGDLRAGLLLDFFLEDIGAAIYNQAIGDAQARMQQRVADLDGELYADEFQYWVRQAARKKGKKQG
jgi:uncharacterized protein (DUF2164 family)